MSTEAFVGDGTERKEGKAMIRRGIGLGSRLAAVAFAMALVLSLAGDRGRAATVPAVINGQDPLEVLSLKIRPNVIVVLDSSGSMMWTLDPNHLSTQDPVNSGDHPRAKLFQAKQVLKTIVQGNQDKVSFLFGQYTQGSGPTMQNRGATHSSSTSGQNRFIYWTSETLSPSMTADELSVERASNDTGNRGLQSWQIIDAQWNTLWFDVGGGDCTASVPPGFYATGASLALALQNAMNAASCGNDYDVSYDGSNGRFSFTRTGGGFFDIHWGNGGPNNIAEALGGRSSTDDHLSDEPYTLLFRADTAPNDWGTYGTGDWGRAFHNTFDEEVPPGSGTYVTNYQLRAGRFFNGEVIRVTGTGEVCGMTFPTVAERTNPPTLILQEVAAGCGADVGSPVTFTWGGAFYTGGSGFCDGFRARVDLIPCDLQSPPAPTQFTTIGPWLDNEAPLDTDGSIIGYSETMDGSWATATHPGTTGGIKGWGSTPIAYSLQDIRGLFANLWNNGQGGATAMTGPPPYALDAIKDHVDPKEKTIVLFITDGDDTCAGSGGDSAARTSAYEAERLYTPVTTGEPASSVQTFVIGYGGGATGRRLNWIAWGGSGLGQDQPGQPDVDWVGDSDTELANARAQCTTCEDAFIAPDAATLAATIQGIIDQGASEGEFSAQQSVTESIFEYVDMATVLPDDVFDPRSPKTRYKAIVPTRIISSFTLPGFRGRLRAIQNRPPSPTVPDPCDGSGQCRWDSGEKLRALVADGMAVDPATRCLANGTTGALLGECSFNQLAGAIPRRIYTTSRNGTYSFTAEDLEAYGRGAWNPTERVNLWPPDSTVAPSNYTSEGSLDEALGLPLNSAADPAAEFVTLQNEIGACRGSNLPSECTSGTDLDKMKAARREARDIILAFMAGAQPPIVGAGGGPKRAVAGSNPVAAGAILFAAKSWVLADSELATPAVVTQPLPSEPQPFQSEYQLFRDGAGTSRADSDVMIKQGFGLRQPDGDLAGTGNDSRNNLKPVMTVVYAPANDMLHAFRAGPSVSPSSACNPSTDECGGEELWGFVPFDQLGALRLRYINDPQGRDNHVYMLARGVRFADVFVAASSPPMSVTVGGELVGNLNGVWRRILFIPRGIGGKYVTALDVTGPGPYTAAALSTKGPVPLWSRGNPDTQDGTAGGSDNGSAADRMAYAEMGETWSMPTVAYRDKSKNPNPLYGDADYVLYMGSGYGAAGEGSTFFTLDALSGDVIAAADVEMVAAANGLDRTGLTYPNALAANAVGFNPAVFSLLTTVHPAASAPTRVYIGDTHGRLWKFLTARPEVPIPMADLGEDQPIATAVSLLGIPPAPDPPVPFVFAVSGNDLRADGPFKMFGFRDEGTDTEVTIGSAVTENDVVAYRRVYSIHTRTFDQGAPLANCGYTEEAVFRGTIQPATAFECSAITSGNCQDPVGRVFFGGTRLSLPNTQFAPPTPLACGLGAYPCRSAFDSILYALGAKTGLAAYDLNASGDDAYRIFRDNRIAAIAMLADPDPARGGSSFVPDESQMKAPPKPPPPPGVPPTAQTATANVMMVRVDGYPPPSVHYGSTVCQ